MKYFALIATAATVFAQAPTFRPVTEQMLAAPAEGDWLMYNRTYDSQRYSPLKQINKANVKQLKLAWSLGQAAGAQEAIPLVHDGIMYLQAPGATIQALDATNGDLKWEYKRKVPANVATGARPKTIAIYGDMVYSTMPDSFVVAVDAKTGELRWESKMDTRGHTSGAVMAGDKVISGGACGGVAANCYLAANDAKTGKLLWKFYTAARSNEPGGDTWGATPDDKRVAGAWGLGGTYDPINKLVIWSVANPTPNTRLERHGDYKAVPMVSPVELYSNCTIALDVETGKLVWYYQHLPGDDWDEDWTNDRTLMRSKINPTAATAKWFNPKAAGSTHDVVVALGESGGVFALDRKNGEFLWANPWPYDIPEFLISKVDPDGKVHINEDRMMTGPNQEKYVCFFNTRSYWPVAYSAATNSVYAPWTDTCNYTQTKGLGQRSAHGGKIRPGSNPNEFSGISKINVETGKIDHIFKGPAPINGAILTTEGGLVIFGDLDRHIRAIDADNGKVLWDQVVGGPIASSTITYAVNGKQYLAVQTGDGLLTGSVIAYVPGLKVPKGHNSIYVFALP
jgi:alcohol dehydrogenase (cytochrome c)